MPGSSPAPDDPALWAALSNMRIDMPAGRKSFEEELAEANGWTQSFAERVADEYCGFLYLAATGEGESTPSQAVDQAWHLHLTLPHYRDTLCNEILGDSLEHRPASDAPGEVERCRGQYEQTVDRYERIFGKKPPADIWPPPVPFEVYENMERRARLQRLSASMSTASGAAAVASFVFGAPILGVVLLGACFLFLVLSLTYYTGEASGRRGSSCGGGGCGGGTDSGDGGGDGGCGGGGCGGGCGGGD